MTIKTKFNIGQEVFALFKDTNVVSVVSGIIEEIIIKEDNILYYLDGICEEYNEDEIVDIADSDGLYSLVLELTERDDSDGREIN